MAKIIVAMLAALLAVPAPACTTFSINESALSPTARLQSQFTQATSVLRAQVTNVKDASRRDPNDLTKKQQVVLARIVVTEAIKGPAPRTVLTRPAIPGCDLVLRPGQEYVLFVDSGGWVGTNSFEINGNESNALGSRLVAIRELASKAAK